MTTSCGLNRVTGQPLTDWDHILQSVDMILDTEIGERIMLFEFGGGNRRLLGRKFTPDLLALAGALFALAIAIWEPRLRVVKTDATATVDEIRLGHTAFTLHVAHRPRGHLGDPTEEIAVLGVGVFKRTEDDTTGVLRTARA